MANTYKKLVPSRVIFLNKGLDPLRNSLKKLYGVEYEKFKDSQLRLYDLQDKMVLDATTGDFYLIVDPNNQKDFKFKGGLPQSVASDYQVHLQKVVGVMFQSLEEIVTTSPVPIKQIVFPAWGEIESGKERPSASEQGSFEIILQPKQVKPQTTQKTVKKGSKMAADPKVSTTTTAPKKPEKTSDKPQKTVTAKSKGVEPKDCYLTMVDSDKNNYKFYKMVVRGDFFTATWGRIGGGGFGNKEIAGVKDYPISDFKKKYNEKIRKGYVDRTEDLLGSENGDGGLVSAASVCGDEAKLFNFLVKFSKQRVYDSLVSENITPAMVVKSKELLGELYKTSDIRSFNRVLMDLMVLCPRKVKKVESQLAKDRRDIPYIFSREEDLLMAMEGIVGNGGTTLDAVVKMATEEQKRQVLSKLSDQLKHKVADIYRITPNKQQNRFDRYLQDKGITNVKQLWHGSRNENWVSIIRNSLKLNPDAIITGKMFGNGIYFAPSSMKSWGYTSGKGAHWTRGCSKDAVMGLYATAYGTPLEVHRAERHTERTLGHYNCVHAKAGTVLRNDEIIYYNESAIVLNYIVTFKC